MNKTPLMLLLVPALVAGWNVAAAQSTIRVPADMDLQQAINQVSAGGLIEVAAGTYPAPANSFRHSGAKSFTIRAVGGGEVILDGEGARPIFRLLTSGAVTFEGLSFRNGYSATESRAGGATVQGANATFRDCRFEDNLSEAPSSGGGGVRVADGANVSFSGCTWSNNSAKNRGGGLEVIASTVTINQSRFDSNQVNLPGHKLTSSGGAIYALNSEVKVQNSRFEHNEAGFSAGAIYALGEWQEPVSVPRATIVLTNTTLVGNEVLAHPGSDHAAPAAGGAVHVENQATLEARTSRFRENRAEWGGAVSSYRALVELDDCVFQGNEAVTTATVVGAGGAVNLTSADFPDATTGSGTINRRPAALMATNTLFQGRFNGVTTTANSGGCIFAAGDTNAQYGENGFPQTGTAEDNRAPVTLTDVILADCDVDETVHGAGSGGGLQIELTDLTMTGSLVIDSDAFGNAGRGGGMWAVIDSAVSLDGTTWAGNTAAAQGGAILFSGGSVQVSDSTFLANEISPGVVEPIAQSNGAALCVSPGFNSNPSRETDVTGVVERSLFADNVGLPIMDLDRNTGPINDVVYNGNRFRSTTFGNKVYLSGLAVGWGEWGGSSVAQLNAGVINRTNGTATDKSTVANQFLGSTPRFGTLVAAPTVVLATVPPGDPGPPTSAFLGYAWSGSTASLDGANLAARRGLREVTLAGEYELRVNATSADTVTVDEGAACTTDTTLCVNQNRFTVEVSWRDFQGNTGSGQVVEAPSADSGLFWFFSEDNWEMLVKVLNACGLNNHFWVFSAATTNVEYTLRVTDTTTGASQTYFNPLGTAAPALTDTSAFATCPKSAAAGEGPAIATRVREPLHAAHRRAVTACPTGGTTLCLNNERFQVQVEWEDFQGNTGAAQVVDFQSNDSGLFWFFDADNWEMLIKVLNACGLNNHYWVFSAATTNVEYALRVVDTSTGAETTYFNPLGNAADAITDTSAFAACP